MVTLIKDNLARIQDVCKKHHVKSFYLIGSAARETDFGSESDVDFLYRFTYENQTETNDIDYAENYFSLLEDLQNVLKRRVDLVSGERNTNPYFINSINQDKQL